MGGVERLVAGLKKDCRHYRSDRPCRPHKERGVLCGDCPDYEPAGLRVTIVKLAAVGDVLRTTALLPGLRRAHPAAFVTWITAPAALPLLAGNPWIDVLLASAGALPARAAARPQDLVLCPDADPQAVALAHGIPLRPGGRQLGFGLDADGEVVPLSEAAARWFAMGLSDELKRANRATYQDLVAAICELPVPVRERPQVNLTPEEREAAAAWLRSAADARRVPGRTIGINTGAGRRWPKKRWTLAGQRALIAELLGRGHRVVLLGGPEEVERHAALRAGAPEGGPGVLLDAGNDNPLRLFAAKLALCDLVVTGDTLALHLATAFSIPVVALFGPTSHAEIELYGNGVKLYAAELDCLGCYGDCDKDPHCMSSISAERVLAAVEDLLAGRPGDG